MDFAERINKLAEMMELQGRRFDERMERLTERHEALAQSVELLLAASQRHDEQIRDLALASQRDGEHINALARHIDALVRIAEIHERRLTDLEGGGE